jgi:tetratricopeptide (TPR) repeat protein
MAFKSSPLAPLQAALKDLTAWLKAAKAPGVVIGGVAVTLLGRPRMTRDIDVLVWLDVSGWQKFLDQGARFDFVPRMNDAVNFARRARVLLVRHQNSGVDVDVSLGALPFEKEAVARVAVANIGGVRVPLPTPEDLIVMKAVANRPQVLRKAKLGYDHHDTLQSMISLAISYSDLGRHKEALKLNEETLALLKAKLGSDHPHTLKSMNNLANSYSDLGRHEEALKLNEETLTLLKAKLGPDHPDTLASMNNLAISYADAGRHAEALKLREETLALRKAKFGYDHPDTLVSMHNLAISFHDLGRHEEALKLREDTLTLRKARLGPDHPETLRSMHNLANSYHALGRHEEALKLREATLPLRKAKLGPEHPDTLWSMNDLAWSLATLPDAELRDAQRALELASKAVEAAPANADFRGTLGAARYRAGDWKGAIADLGKAISLRKSDNAINANEGYFLAMAHWQLGEKEKAREWFDKATAGMDKSKREDAELKRFRAEAAELLGIAEKP